MDTKLTIKLENRVIQNAKLYAKMRNTSLSRMIENYLQKVTEESETDTKITPLVKSLSGIISVADNFEAKQGYADYLINKYK